MKFLSGLFSNQPKTNETVTPNNAPLNENNDLQQAQRVQNEVRPVFKSKSIGLTAMNLLYNTSQNTTQKIMKALDEANETGTKLELLTLFKGAFPSISSSASAIDVPEELLARNEDLKKIGFDFLKGRKKLTLDEVEEIKTKVTAASEKAKTDLNIKMSVDTPLLIEKLQAFHACMKEMEKLLRATVIIQNMTR